MLAIQNAIFYLKNALESKLCKKENGDSQIVVALVLIAVAVGLCIIFRNQVRNIMISLINIVSNQINNLTNGSLD